MIHEDRAKAPQPVTHPVVFATASDPDYLRILKHIRSAGERLDAIKRFDMPGFRPRGEYLREMKRYGVLPSSFDLTMDPVDPYALDARYWRTFWHHPKKER